MNRAQELHQEERFDEALQVLMETHAFVRKHFGPQSEEVITNQVDLTPDVFV